MNQTTQTATNIQTLAVAPARVMRGTKILSQSGEEIAQLGNRPLIVGGDRTLAITLPVLQPVLEQQLQVATADYGSNSSEASLAALKKTVAAHQADLIIGVGGGKALDTAKLLAYHCNLPVVTIPTSAATCAAWTALSNIYTDDGGFLYDVSLSRCPNLVLLDYDLIQTAPQHTLVAGIGDALAKWYEASISSAHSEDTLTIAAVQQARVLRDILFQKSVTAIQEPGSAVWREVVDATVLLAGVIGGLGGAQCRTVAAHAVHNGLTHLHIHEVGGSPVVVRRGLSDHSIHGEKVAYGILVQLRLEEMLQGNQLAATARQQLLKFYNEIGLPKTLHELGMGSITIEDLQRCVEIACDQKSDIHRLPFKVAPEQLMAAMVSTTAPTTSNTLNPAVRMIPDEVSE
ncbi:iron-containing alcohol dehydrogenase family protein [Gloeocapsopsis dulcis]|uniref:Oxidoreductase n=1 Tax=Gloeocapsopsis dulcis AAB1 = 1H9 TaxID=1433147 RepID=A0A6N8G3W0_9CHRO|nr:iron-containing alcohol dehydrogenase family protein [Gloeocapsopsis dulcis]MUL39105.1 oxidoreductase [Gloeocapsopsis dulcis AAB1 = 1H9]WNN88643.1 iron-containing alcohol dehydrogenase family protein [Gloeocapsopsis dulcis]